MPYTNIPDALRMQHCKIMRLLSEGEENAVHMDTLAAMLQVDERTVRFFVEKARRDGIPIGSTDSGYFLPSSDDEAIRCYARAQARRRSAEIAVQALEPLALRSTLLPFAEGDSDELD